MRNPWRNIRGMAPALRTRIGPIFAVLLFLTAGALYADAVPPWEAPDEPWHVAYVEALAGGRLPSSTDTYESHQPPLYYLWPALYLRASGSALVPRSVDNPWFPLAPAAYLHPAGEPARPLLLAMRAFSGLLGSLVVVLAWAAARAGTTGPGSGSRALLAAVLVALLPQFVFVSHSISNDVAAAACGALIVYGAVALAAGRRGFVWSGLAIAFGLLVGAITKVNVLPLAPVAVVAAWPALRSRHWGPRAIVAAAAGLAAVVFVTASLAAAFAAVAPTTAGAMAADAMGRLLLVRPELAQPIPLAQQSARLLVSAWARFGWLNVDLPVWITLAAAVAVGVGVAGASIAWFRAPDSERRALLVAGVAVGLCLLAALKNLVVDPQPQGRFLFPSLGAIAFLLTNGWWWLMPRRASRLLLPALVLSLAGVNLYAVHSVLPEAYAESRLPAPSVDVRLVAEPRRVVVRLDGESAVARQTFSQKTPGLWGLALAPAEAGDAGHINVRLVDPAGETFYDREFDITSLKPDGWWVIDLAPGHELAAGQYALELSVDVDGELALYGAPRDAYKGGRLTYRGEELPDLFLLTFYDRHQ